MSTTIRRVGGPAIVAAAVFALGGCDSDPTGNEDHIDPVGIVIVSGSTDVVSVRGLDIIGAFQVNAGGQTDPFDILFVDERGNRFVPTEPDEWLRVTVSHPSLAEWVGDGPGAWSGSIRGLQAGTTTVRFELMHGPVNDDAASHRDFGTPGVPLLVINSPGGS